MHKKAIDREREGERQKQLARDWFFSSCDDPNLFLSHILPLVLNLGPKSNLIRFSSDKSRME